MNKLKVMVVGQKWLAERLLAWCLNKPNIKVVAVSPPNETDKLAALATTHKIPITPHGKTLTADQVPNGVDIILTAHAYCFVEKQARDKARLGAVGYHPSLLPKYKGKTAVKDAFENGDKVVGGSLYQLDDGWDTGQVLAQRSISVDDNDTLTTLWQEKLAPIGVDLFREYLTRLF
ncbi:formyl transferase [Moraxella catarrhalis]|uniref:Formyl transferase family protein n=2 Tax=Moraxella catarrhalis TaxID=480 RepID=A0A3Q9GD42_MORCA|nr:formyltransferase family protein [Moraxella catarrhalis]ARE65449.1 formyl transferase [Moraxella catarrhalis]AZQ93080.1 formyl transferase family protein [Moraxella catarrhalis]AZQ93317.1 formyl transferase family protein [Moraxella catarrhalis]EGE15060.1 putative Formyl transferase, N-terminal:amino acid-binding ACT [Moraxella catarrhalis 103P14B1]MDE4520056.1 formyl transferase [Moraxella catarrhalis]